jgi:anthranilate phosphoribosyltransferase
VFELREGHVHKFEVNAKDFGVAVSTLDDIRGGDPKDNLEILKRTFAGEAGPVRDIVTFNAGCAMYVAGLVGEVSEGLDRARASIDSGAAQGVLDAVISVSQREAARMEKMS